MLWSWHSQATSCQISVVLSTILESTRMLCTDKMDLVSYGIVQLSTHLLLANSLRFSFVASHPAPCKSIPHPNAQTGHHQPSGAHPMSRLIPDCCNRLLQELSAIPNSHPQHKSMSLRPNRLAKPPPTPARPLIQFVEIIQQ